MNNNSDNQIIHPAICVGASQIVFMAEEKLHEWISLLPVTKMLRNGD